MGAKADWIKLIENWQCSGLSQAAYCRQHDLTYHRFTARLASYRKTVKSADPTVTARSQPTTFISVQVEPPGVATHSISAEPSVTMTSDRMVFCHAHGHRLEWPLSVSAAWVAQLLQCLD